MLIKVTDVYNKEISKIDSYHTGSAVINLDFVLKKDKSYYSQIFFKEFKYTEKKVVRHIHDGSSDFSCSFDESDEE